MFLAVIVFILVLGVLIFVHEMGHFLVARRNGIKAEEFGFGFPPRIFGVYKSEKSEKYKFVPGNKNIRSKNTVYSLNWIPLGGFVKIKGEDGGEKKDSDSFAGKSAWVRTKVLAAGVIMNFVLAWVLISIVFMLGSPQATNAISKDTPNAKIQISEISPDSPASTAGLKVGDEISKIQINSANQKIKINSIKDLQNYINIHKGQKIILAVKRGPEKLNISITPRINTPSGQGPLGVALVETSLVRYPWYKAIWTGLITTLNLTWAILVALGTIIKNLFIGHGVSADVAGPVGIAVLTKQVTEMGLIYILQFAALLSINLGIINAFPFPALDGGRILFIVIEKIKGHPVSQKVEQAFHTSGFILLIILLVLITFHDVAKFIK